MGGPAEVVAEAVEASRQKEQVLAQHARAIGRAAATIVDALRAGRTLHVLGDGPRAALAIYAADLFFRADLAARALPAADDHDGLLRAVNGFVQAGDVVLLLLLEARPGLDRAVLRARAKGAACLAVLGEPAVQALAPHCDQPISAASSKPAVVGEVLLATTHVLLGIVQDGLARASAAPPPAPTAAPLRSSRPPERPPSQERGPVERPITEQLHPRHAPPEPVEVPRLGTRASELGVIDEDPDAASGHDGGGDDDTEESALLAEAVEDLAAPQTDPRAARRRPKPTSRVPAPTASSPGPGLVRFRCGGCDEPIVVEERHAGRRGQCPHCRAEFTIPSAQNDATATQKAPVLRSGAQPDPKALRSGAQPAPKQAPPKQKGSTDSERRRAMRVLVKDALVRYAKDAFPDGTGYVEPQMLEDLSLTGMRFVGRAKELEVGDVLCFVIDFPAFPEPVRVKGEVRRVVKLKSGGGWGAGVRFVQWHGDAEARVRRLVENVQLRGVRRR